MDDAKNDAPRSGPPPIGSILPDVAGRTDTGYTLRVHMHGLLGIWHRLWALIVITTQLADPEDVPPSVADLRAEFEQQLGRAMRAEEWVQLEAHAKAHAKRLSEHTLRERKDAP